MCVIWEPCIIYVKPIRAKKKSYSWKVGKKGQKSFNICLIDIYVDNSFVGIRELILTDKSCKCWLKNVGIL